MTQKFIRTKSGPITVEFLCHISESAYDKEAGYSGAMAEDAHRWHVHRSTINLFYADFIPKVEILTGIPRRVDEKKTLRKKSDSQNPDRISPIYESYTNYLTRIFPETTEALREEILSLALSLSQTFKVNVAPAERNSPVDICYYKRADSVLEQPLDIINQKISKLLQSVPNFQLARESNEKPQRDSLARLYQQYQLQQWSEQD